MDTSDRSKKRDSLRNKQKFVNIFCDCILYALESISEKFCYEISFDIIYQYRRVLIQTFFWINYEDNKDDIFKDIEKQKLDFINILENNSFISQKDKIFLYKKTQEFVFDLTNLLISKYPSEELKKNSYEYVYPFKKMDEDLYSRYCEIGKQLGLTEKQARYFSCVALNVDREKTCQITDVSYRGLGSVKREVGKKLGFSSERSDYKDRKMKELAEELLNSETLEALKKTYNSTIQEKIDIAREYHENKQIADMVRANPELLQALQQMQQNQQG